MGTRDMLLAHELGVPMQDRRHRDTPILCVVLRLISSFCCFIASPLLGARASRFFLPAPRIKKR